MSTTEDHADVGVIVARFQTHELHEGQRMVLDTVKANHNKYLIFLGLSPLVGGRNNALDFQARKQMVLEAYPEANVLYIKDMEDDVAWSKKLDAQVADLVGPTSTVMMYGSRDSFVQGYHGKWPTAELEQVGFLSATAIRKRISQSTKPDASFRAGVFHNAYNQYPKLMPTVDVAIWNEEGTKLLMGRKADEKLWRFCGGFVEPGVTDGPNPFEANARKEVHEEAGVEITDPQYVGSYIIDDWRLRSEADAIGTILFEAKHMFGQPKPGDDIEELMWFETKGLVPSLTLVPGHKPLFTMLLDRTKLGARDYD